MAPNGAVVLGAAAQGAISFGNHFVDLVSPLEEQGVIAVLDPGTLEPMSAWVIDAAGPRVGVRALTHDAHGSLLVTGYAGGVINDADKLYLTPPVHCDGFLAKYAHNGDRLFHRDFTSLVAGPTVGRAVAAHPSALAIHLAGLGIPPVTYFGKEFGPAEPPIPHVLIAKLDP